MSLCPCPYCHDPLCGLTERERELLDLLMVYPGASNRDLAKRMDIGTSTVKKHLSNIYRALSVSNRSHAILIYLQNTEKEP